MKRYIIGAILTLLIVLIVSIFWATNSSFSGQRTVLLSASCDGFSLEYVRTVSPDIAVTHYKNTLEYKTLFKTRLIDQTSSVVDPSTQAGDNFNSQYLPEYFTWFGSITNSALGAENIDASPYWNIQVNAFQFSPPEYTKISTCIKNNLRPLSVQVANITGSSIGSVAYIPRIDFQTQAHVFMCPNKERIVLEDEGATVKVSFPAASSEYEWPAMSFGHPVGFVDEKGFFKEHIWWKTSETEVRPVLNIIDNCIDSNGKNIHTYFADWRTTHSKDFTPAK